MPSSLPKKSLGDIKFKQHGTLESGPVLKQQSTLESGPVQHSTIEKSTSNSQSSRAFPTSTGFVDAKDAAHGNLLHKILSTDDLEAIRIKFQAIKAQALDHQDSCEINSSLITSSSLLVPPPNIQDENAEMEHRPTHSMNLDEWLSSLGEVFYNRMNITESATDMFKEMDTHSKGYVVWGDVIDLLIRHMAPNSLQSTIKYISHNGKFRSIQHARRETIQKIIGVATGTTFVYIIVSKFGHVGIYDEKFRLQKKYDVDIDTDPNADLDVAASDPGWITDAIWMDNSKHAVYTTSLRTMHFFDASASVHYEEYRAFGFKNIPNCIDYWFDTQNSTEEALMLFGDDAGGLTLVTFHQPLNSLFSKDEVDNVQCLFWPDIARHSEYASVNYMPGIHKDAIQGVKYLPHNNTVITISRDPSSSILIRHCLGKFEPYVFKLGWGVRCFDYKISGSLHILATGSNDKIVRLWNPVVTSRPRAVLTGHRSGINDVKIHMGKLLVISYDKTSVVKIWHIDQPHCLQTLPLSFPCFKVLGKEIEYGRPAFYLQLGNDYILLATCCEYVTTIELTEDDDEVDEDHVDIDESASDVEKSIPGSRSEHRSATPEVTLPTHEGLNAEDFPQMASLMFPKEMLARYERKSSSSGSSGWSQVRNTLKVRARAKVFGSGTLEDDSSYVPFRIFQEKKTFEDDDSINVLRVKKYANNSRMEELARDNMPFMGIQVHGLDEAKLCPDLPHTSGMIQKGLKIRTMEQLTTAKLDHHSNVHGHDPESGVSAELGESGSSATGSRRSSATVGPKKPTMSKKELTPMSSQMAQRRSSNVGDGKGLPIITEKSDTQSINTDEVSSIKD